MTKATKLKRQIISTEKSSPFIRSVHVETTLDLAPMLGFYRTELGKRGWTEDSGAVVEPDRAVIAFTTTDGPALLRLNRQDDRTIADLSLRKPGAATADVLPRPGQVRLMLGNETDEEGRHHRQRPDRQTGSSHRTAAQPGDRSAARQVQTHTQGGERCRA